MSFKRRQTGFTLIETMVCIALMALALVVYAELASDSAERSQETLAAQSLRQVADAANRYISDNSAALRASATASTPVQTPLSTLISGNYLPPQFDSINDYRQSYVISTLQPSPGVLSTLIVTSGGDAIDEGSLRRIARQVGSGGGYVSVSNTADAIGAFGAWSVPLAGYGANVGAGHLAASLFFQDGQQVSDYLYRSAVAGHPEVQQMAAPIDMGNNNIANAANVTANGAVQAGSITSTGRVSVGEFLSLGTAITVGTSCPQIGVVGREADGRLASCVSVSGVLTWERAGY